MCLTTITTTHKKPKTNFIQKTSTYLYICIRVYRIDVCMKKCVHSKLYKYLNANILNNRNLNILLGEISQGLLSHTDSKIHKKQKTNK